MKKIRIDSINTEGLQTRVALDEQAVVEYAGDIKNGCELPPVTIFSNGEVNYLADGFHRLEAMKRLGETEINADVKTGGRIDALKYALKANQAHGVRRTNRDKRNALKIAWENRMALFGGNPSVRELALETAVSLYLAHDFIVTGGVLEYNTPSPAAFEAQGKDPAANDGEAAAAVSGAKDRYGVPIPPMLVGAFTSKQLGKMGRSIRSMAKEIEQAREKGDYAFARISQSTLITLKNAAADLKSETPWCVCRLCGGRGCRACGETGVQTKMEYERCPGEVKVERLKS